jgi:leucyl aminopeptidase (aminopeptidase T)
MNRIIVDTIVRKCLGYRKGERFLIVHDEKREELATSFYNIAQRLGIDVSIVNMRCRKMHGEEPPETVREALKKADAAVLFTTMSLSHTKARKTASTRFGTRIASLPGVTVEMLKRAIPLDYESLRKRARNVAQILTKANKAEIRTKKGTHITMSLKGRKGFIDSGLYLDSGSFGNLPAGEACIAPLENSTNGRLIVDGSAPLVGKLKQPVEIIIKNGYAQNVPIKRIASAIKKHGKKALNVAEFGIGLNPKAKLTGSVLEDEKVMGTCHIALGNNKSFGGHIACPSHLDFVTQKPTIKVDGKALII